MIPQDLIQRINRAHDAAVKAAQLHALSNLGTQRNEQLLAQLNRAEARFESALAAIVDAAGRKR